MRSWVARRAMRGENGPAPWGCCAASPSGARGVGSSSWRQDRATLAAWCGGSRRACSPGVESDTVGRTYCRRDVFNRGEGESNVRMRGKSPGRCLLHRGGCKPNVSLRARW
jgi:hypothetical protein